MTVIDSLAIYLTVWPEVNADTNLLLGRQNVKIKVVGRNTNHRLNKLIKQYSFYLSLVLKQNGTA